MTAPTVVVKAWHSLQEGERVGGIRGGENCERARIERRHPRTHWAAFAAIATSCACVKSVGRPVDTALFISSSNSTLAVLDSVDFAGDSMLDSS